MNELLFHGMTLNYPDDFHVLDDEERKGMQTIGDGEWTGLSAPERHVIITVGWKRAGGLFGAMLNTEDMKKNTEKAIAKAMRPYDYHKEKECGYTLDGETFKGFRYSYTAQGTKMTGETLILKKGSDHYELHFYGRTEFLEDENKLWEEVLHSLRWETAE